MRLLVWPITLLAVVASLAAAATARAATNPAATAIFRLSGGDVAAASGMSRYGYVTLNAWNADRIAELKAENPGIKVLVYKDMASTRSYAVHDGVDDALLPTGIGYAYASNQHPEWFLTDTTGSPMEWGSYGGHWWMDIGDPAYQQKWLDNVAAELRAQGWDGVVIDNAMADPQWYLAGRTIAKYPTKDEYRDATRSFLARVGPGLTSRGFLVLPNISDPTTSLWNDWIQFTSGANFEHWTKWSGAAAGSGYIDGDYWLMHADMLKATQDQGKIFLANTTSTTTTDTHTMRYARASFLLWWNGGPSALAFSVNATDPWSPEWTIDIGQPAGPAYQTNGTWRRDYTGGTVIANPSKTTSSTTTLETTYQTPEGTSTTQITLQPTSGIILRSVAPAPTPAPTPTPTPTPTPDTTAPSLTVTSPTTGSTVKGRFTIQATAGDASGIAKVTFVIDGRLVSTDTTAPYGYTATAKKGWHTIVVTAYDQAGNATSVTLAVRVR